MSLGGAFSFPVNAFEVKEEFPKLANYYLQSLIPSYIYSDLAKYDLLILDVDTQTHQPEMFTEIEKKNPQVQFLAYILSESINIEYLDWWARFRKMTYQKVESEDWWLRDSQGDLIGFSEIWPDHKFVDPGNGWVEYMSDLVAQDVASRDIWDGIFYDMVFGQLDWLNDGDFDIDKDGIKDSPEEINSYWQEHTKELMDQTKAKINPKVLVANLDLINYYQDSLNGTMIENFPAQWLGEDAWPWLIDQYINHFPANAQDPQIYVINANTDNIGHMADYQKMRFGLTSALLGDGYYSFDKGDQSHAQNWWYDEYNVSLGKAISKPSNLLDLNNQEVKPGLWRRDFEQGVALVNSTNQEQTYAFSGEEFEKINGIQDRRINNGTKINLVTIDSNDGVVLLKTNQEIRNSSFNNGSFVRIFNDQGQQTQNGFFAFKSQFPGNVQVLTTDLDNDGKDETLVNGNGIISVYEDNRKIREFKPYDFEGDVFLSTGDVNGDGVNEIVTGVGLGGGPHVKVLDQEGQIISEFMAYDERFRGGVSVSVGDINNDGIDEIVTGTGITGGPHVKIVDQYGNLINEFMAYDERFRGGVNVALGDLNSDGSDEIITGAGPTGGPHVKVFNQHNRILNEFMAYNENDRSGIMVMSDDLDKNNFYEILVGIINF